jgi:hypothetical protein
MASSKLSDTLIGREVEHLFGGISARRGDLCENPVTGGEFVYGFDPIRLQKKMAYHALCAREDFAINGPADAPRLPLEYWECERVRWSAGPWITSPDNMPDPWWLDITSKGIHLLMTMLVASSGSTTTSREARFRLRPNSSGK